MVDCLIKRTVIRCVATAIVSCVLLPLNCSARTFSAEGGDAVAGLGARQIAMGGTGVASSRGSYAVYYGAAGLSSSDKIELTYDRELGAMKPISFLGIALPTDFGREWGLKSHIGLGYYPRIYAKATGAFAEDDFESIFLRYLLHHNLRIHPVNSH